MNNINLFLDTSQSTCNIAIFDNKKIIDCISIPTKNNMTDIVIEKIDSFLLQNNIDKDVVKNFYFTTGPGSFTGVRVACLIAKSWMIINQTNLFSIDSLSLQIPRGKKGISILDAKGKKFFMAIVNHKNKIIGKPKLISPEQLQKISSNYEVYRDYETINIFDNVLTNIKSFKHCKNINKVKCFYLKEPINANN